MPKLDNLRESTTTINSEPFVIAGPDGKMLFAGRVRILLNPNQAGVRIITIKAEPGVRLIESPDGLLDFVSVVDHNDDGPQRA